MKSGCCVWKNGNIIDANKEHVSVFDHGFLYGDGVFEGIRFYHEKPFLLEKHLQRLDKSLSLLNIHPCVCHAELEQGILACISASGLQNGYIRLIVTRGEGPLGIDPRKCALPTVLIVVADLELVSDQQKNEGLSLCIATIRRNRSIGIDSRVKSLNYLVSVMAKMEANMAGADEALLLNQEGFVAECSAENLFIVKDRVLITPPAIDGALEGITRETLMSLADEMGIEVKESSFLPYDIVHADECFLSGTGARLLPVKSLNNHRIGDGNREVFDRLHLAFQRFIERTCQSGS